MARRAGLYGYRKKRRLIYVVSAVVIVAVVLIYNSSDEEPEVTSARSSQEKVMSKTELMPSVSATQLPEIAGRLKDEPDSQTAELIAHAFELADANPARIIESRDILNEVLHSMSTTSQQRAVIKDKLTDLSARWLFSRRIFPQDMLCDSYRVKPGDILSKIGDRHKVPYQIIADINKISNPQSTRAGEKIKVINGPFHARIYRSTFTMDLYLQNTFVCSFPVGLGRSDRKTPTGHWLVKQGGKLIKPAWTDPDSGRTYEAENPDYPLGSRWIGLEGLRGQAKGRTGFAIHGTKDANEIGSATSKGCIRLHNGDAILIYNLLIPGFSQVVVVD